MNSSSDEEVPDSEDEAYRRGISIEQLRAERYPNGENRRESTSTSYPTRTVRFADMEWDPHPHQAESIIPNIQEEVEDIRYGIRGDSDESDHQPLAPEPQMTSPPPQRPRNGVAARKSVPGTQRDPSVRLPPRPQPRSALRRPLVSPALPATFRGTPLGHIPNQSRRIEDRTFRNPLNPNLPPRPPNHFQQPMNPNLPPRPSNYFRQPVNPNLPPRPFNHFQQPMSQSSLPRGMPQPRLWQPRRPVRPPQEIKVLDNSAFVAERTSERRQLHFLPRPITSKSSGLARRSFVDTEEQIQTVLEPLLRIMDTELRDESSEESEERLNNSFRTLWSERTEMRGARKRIITSPAHSLEPEENYIENPAVEPMDISDDHSAPEPMRELTTPRFTTRRGVTAVKTSNYAQRQTNHPPSDNLLSALERVTHLQLVKLPFLRRNLKTGFIHAFVRHYSDRDRPIPKISRIRGKHPINVRWMYTLKEQRIGSDPQSVSWAAVQDSWRCQLCNTFHSFKSGSLLLFHLRRDHNEVVTRLRKLTPGHWLLQVDLSNAENVENDSADRRTSSSPSPLLIRGPTPFMAPPGLKSETDDDTSRAFTTPEQDLDIPVPSNSIHENRDMPPVYRSGGMRIYDVAMREMPLPLKGLSAQAWLTREEDMIYYSIANDQDKAMGILWGRWIAQYRLCFVEDPASNMKDFITQHWRLIEETAGKHAFILLLLTLKFHRNLNQDQVEELSVYYRSCNH